MAEIWSMLTKGGIVMIPLFMTSIVAVTVVVERAVFLFRNRASNPILMMIVNSINKPKLLIKFKSLIDILKSQDKVNIILDIAGDEVNFVVALVKIDKAETVGIHECSLTRIFRVAIEHEHDSPDEIKEAILDQGRQETRQLERGLVALETVAGIAPLLGLLGTVLGMIKVFSVISESGLGQTQLLSGGISEALFTTVVGLSIAIPSLIAYNYFNHKVEDLVLEIEQYSSQFLKKLKNMNGA
ncbi:MotA/TolQ/ExbB proton channel family protein [bacterium]